MTKSRGIGSGRRPIHGHSARAKMSGTYNSWRAMIGRCREASIQSADYAERGITVCDRWRTFAFFLEDMGERPKGMTIERTNNDRGYNPENCVWAPQIVNNRNRRTTKLTADVRTRIVGLRAEGFSYKRIAKEIGASETCVGEFLRGENWRCQEQPFPRPPGIFV